MKIYKIGQSIAIGERQTAVNNVAIVMLSTIIGLALFKEQIFKKNWIGILIAIISIILVTLA